MQSEGSAEDKGEGGQTTHPETWRRQTLEAATAETRPATEGYKQPAGAGRGKAQTSLKLEKAELPETPSFQPSQIDLRTITENGGARL